MTPTATSTPPLAPRVLVPLAIATGASVANLFYIQPLVPLVAEHFEIATAAAGGSVAVTQAGYAVGTLFITPLGDLVDRRRLSVTLLIASAGALLLAAASATYWMLILALALVSAGTSAAGVLMALAALLTPVDRRGSVVGVVVSAALIGQLLARTISGLLGDWLGWRAPLMIAALAMIILAAIIAHRVPAAPGIALESYPNALRSLFTMSGAHPSLRTRMVYGSCGMASFGIAWTGVVLLLAGPTYELSAGAIGLFGLAGVVGILAARGFGRSVDRGLLRRATGLTLACVVAAWAVFATAELTIVAVVVGLLLVDAAVHGQNVLSQSFLFTLDPAHAGRLSTIYTTSNLVASSVGAATAALVWSTWGWTALCATGGFVSFIALGTWLAECYLSTQSSSS